jgi:hypothetical protein
MKPERRTRRGKVAHSDPAWEAAQAARRNLDNDDATQESFFLTKQFYALWGNRVVTSPIGRRGEG